jgi:hypothetical protein
MKTITKKINMGFSQQTFSFEQPHEQNSTKEVLAFINSTIADNGQVTFEQVASHFSMQSDRWTKPLIRNLINDLFNDDKIHFIINGKKIMPENIKALLSDPVQSQSKFMQTRETLSILKTHFYKPARWKYVEIIKPEVIEESVLLKAQYIGKKLFNDIGPVSQNSMCRNIRRHLRMWRGNLEDFQKVAGTGGYPGTNEIRKGLDLLNKLLSIYDPYQFIETFLNNKDRLCDAYFHFVILKNFYENQIHIWDTLIKAVDTFKPNRILLEKDPAVKKALETLCKILKNPELYSMIKEIKALIATVKAANDPIVEEQIASAKALAVERIEKKIDKLVKVLDEKKANSDTRNKALFPLQTGKKKINMASNFQHIADYLENAIDQFDNAMEILR